jgi:hypothetical protein
MILITLLILTILGSVYDELVIPLESQIVPAFIFQIDRANFGDVWPCSYFMPYYVIDSYLIS